MSRRLSVVLLSGILLLSLGVSGASAKHGNDHTRRGDCRFGTATYSLTVKHVSGPNLQVRFVISHVGLGTTWQLFGSDDGYRIFSVSKIALTGTVSVTRKIPDLDGPDTVNAIAHNVLPGEDCQGTVTI